MDLAKNLIDFGLSEKEAKAYLALLELEVATAHEVATKADINRSSAYVVLESLRRRGLSSISTGEPTKKYVALSPSLLTEKAAAASEELARVEKMIDKILPDLKSLYSGTKQKPRIRVYEGKEGILALLREDYEMKEKVIRVCESCENVQPFYKNYMPTYASERKKRGIKMYSIALDTPENRDMAAQMLPTDEIILIPKGSYKLPSDFAVFDSSTSFLSHTDSYAVNIESKEFADIMKTIFELALLGAKQVGTRYAPLKQ